MEEKLSALIVDDEESARKLLCKLLEETHFFKDIRQAQSVTSANKVLAQFNPDLIFLDIKMPGRDGFALLQELPQKYRLHKIVFVTAYDQYVIKAIRNQAFDYLLKPINRNELKQCIIRFIDNINEASDNIAQIKVSESDKRIDRIRINTRTGTFFINPSDILYCEADGNYTTICLGRKQHLCSMNLGKVEELLPEKSFIRVGRSHIINFEYITLLDRRKCTVTLIKDSESVTIKIPRQHLKDLDIF